MTRYAQIGTELREIHEEVWAVSDPRLPAKLYRSVKDAVELQQSIETFQMHPVLVAYYPGSDLWQLIAGQRRLLAKRLNVTDERFQSYPMLGRIAVNWLEFNSEEEALKWAFTENAERTESVINTAVTLHKVYNLTGGNGAFEDYCKSIKLSKREAFKLINELGSYSELELRSWENSLITESALRDLAKLSQELRLQVDELLARGEHVTGSYISELKLARKQKSAVQMMNMNINVSNQRATFSRNEVEKAYTLFSNGKIEQGLKFIEHLLA